jgi:hypothetical protein
LPPEQPPRRRQANCGSFRPGFDPRRHRFTTSDCRLGYWVTMLGLTERTQDPAVREWVKRKVFAHFSQKNRGQASSAATCGQDAA